MHRTQIVESSTHHSRSVGIIWRTTKINDNYQTGHNGITNGYKSYFGFDKEYKVGVIVLASNGKVDTRCFGEQFLATIQTSLRDDEIKKFSLISKRLIPYFQLKKSRGYRAIFDKRSYNKIGSDEKWLKTLTLMKNKYGRVEKIIAIKPYNKNSSNLILKTSKGTLSYSLSLSNQEKHKLSGVHVIDYQVDINNRSE